MNQFYTDQGVPQRVRLKILSVESLSWPPALLIVLLHIHETVLHLLKVEHVRANVVCDRFSLQAFGVSSFMAKAEP
jgi:hypothetical protein